MPGVHTFYDGATFLQPVADKIGVEVDRVNFVLCMFSSLPLAYLYREYLGAGKVSRQTRSLAPLLVGLTFLFFCFGRAVKHLLANALISYGLMYCVPPKHVHIAVFVFSMGYLLWIHFYRWLILTSYCLDITGPMMVSVQKITTIAFSLHDGKGRKVEELSEVQKKEAISELPTLLDYTSYIFNFQTTMTGPVNFYVDYASFLDGTHLPVRKDGSTPCPNSVSVRKLAESFIYLIAVVLFGHKYPVEIIATEEYLALPFLQWIFFWWFTIVVIRCNYYFAWTFADSVCNMSGYGFSGFDSDGEAKWELCTNVRPMQVEFAQSFKETLDGWNTQTGGWFRRIAYDRTPKNIRTVATYTLSAVWHGVAIGYYMCFSVAALFTIAAAVFRRRMRWRFVDCPNKKMAYDAMSFIATKMALAYATLPFVTMNLHPAWEMWMRVWFAGHVIAASIYFVLPKFVKGPPTKEMDSMATEVSEVSLRSARSPKSLKELSTRTAKLPSNESSKKDQ